MCRKRDPVRFSALLLFLVTFLAGFVLFVASGEVVDFAEAVVYKNVLGSIAGGAFVAVGDHGLVFIQGCHLLTQAAVGHADCMVDMVFLVLFGNSGIDNLDIIRGGGHQVKVC